MTTTTFSHAAADRTSSSALQGLRAFALAWFQATPAYLVYRTLVG